MKKKLCNCITSAEGLGQPHADSMVVHLVSVSPNESRLVDSLGFLVLSLTMWVVKSCLLTQRVSQPLPNVSLILCFCFYELLGEASLMTIGLSNKVALSTENLLQLHST